MILHQVLLSCLLLCGLVTADLSTHTYEKGERIELFLNKIGPYANPQENYAYFSLPFCQPNGMLSFVPRDPPTLTLTLTVFSLPPPPLLPPFFPPSSPLLPPFFPLLPQPFFFNPPSPSPSPSSSPTHRWPQHQRKEIRSNDWRGPLWARAPIIRFPHLLRYIFTP